MSARKIDENLARLRGELKKQKVMLYLSNEMYAEFKALCARKKFSMNEVITELVREYLEDSAKAEKKK